MCGIFGILCPAKRDVAKHTYFALYSLQHRGQESCGIAATDGTSLMIQRSMGLVSSAFSERELQELYGYAALGHVRYSTTGRPNIENAQPLKMRYKGGTFALAHNGNIVNIKELREQVSNLGISPYTSSDTELMGHIIANNFKNDFKSTLADVCNRFIGAYSLVFLTEEEIYAIRDPWGFRPLCMGSYEDGYVVSSETCAFDIIGAKFVKEIGPGEMVRIHKNGYEIEQILEPKGNFLCSFEYIYFARPDSVVSGKRLYEVRKKFGELLAEESPVDADIVVSVPDSGTPAAIGFAQRCKIPFNEVFIKNRYVGRTFIQPTKDLRERGVRLKLNPISELVRGKRVVVVDDSIVRGTTSKEIVKMLWECEPKEIHFRVSSPMVSHPCFYGIDTASRGELLASKMNLEQIREFLGVNSLAYLSRKSTVEAIGIDYPCLACFGADYPTYIPSEEVREKYALEKNEK
jgi:amidophosphoribosyltransferase